MTGASLRWSDAAEEAARIAEGWRGDEPGGAIILFDADNIRSEACGGLADLASGARFTPETVSRYASISKHLFASFLIGCDRAPALDDPLGAHLGGLAGATAAVTAGRALDMTGGLHDVRETLSLLGVALATPSDAGAILDLCRAIPDTNFPAGTEISYSNTGYRLLDMAMRAKGLHFQEDLDRRINRPLGLSLRAPELWTEPVKNLAPGYWKSADDWRTGLSGMHLSASGCVAGSGRDLARWLQALMADRDPARGVLARLSAQRRLNDGRSTAYGLGLARTRLGGRTLFGHGGSHPGYKAYFLVDPEARAGVAFVANREDAASFPIALRLMAALLGETPPEAGCNLREGLYASEDGPFWLEVRNGTAAFLGTAETLYRASDGASVSLSAHFPMRLRQDGDAIAGEIGHVARRFRPAPIGLADPEGLAAAQGEWRCAAFRAGFAVADDRLIMGIGPTITEARLIALGGGRFIGETPDGPWPKRFCLAVWNGEARLASNRSRILRFRRG